MLVSRMNDESLPAREDNEEAPLHNSRSWYSRRAFLVSVAVGHLALPSCSDMPALLGLDHWREAFDKQSASYWNYCLPRAQSSDSRDYYDLAYGIDAYVSMFEATGGVNYLDAALTLVEGMISQARESSSLGVPAWRDSFDGWVTMQADLMGEEVPLFESYCWRYVSRLLTAMKDSGTSITSSNYQERYQSILSFTEVQIFDKWYARGINAHVYRENTNMASHWAYIALHLGHNTLNATRRARCALVRTTIDATGLPNYGGDSLRKKMTASLAQSPRGSYSWSPAWNSVAKPIQDTSHGSAEVGYICESFTRGTGLWNQADLNRLGETLTTLIMPAHARYVDGTGAGNGWIADGWPKLGRFSAKVQTALQEYDVKGQGQYLATLCANARLLGRS